MASDVIPGPDPIDRILQGTADDEDISEVIRTALDTIANKAPEIAKREKLTLTNEELYNIGYEIKGAINDNANSVRSVLSQEGIRRDLISHSIDELLTQAVLEAKNRKSSLLTANNIRDAFQAKSIAGCSGSFPFWN